MTGIHTSAIIEAGARLGAGVKIGPYCIVGANAQIGDNTELLSHVVVGGHTTIGADCVIHPFVSLGGAPQHLRYKGERVELIIGARTILREHVTMNAGTPFGRGKTVVGTDGFFMTSSHVAHDCIVGNHAIFANNAVIGGHVEIGNNVMLGGNSAVHQYARVGDQAFVGGMTGVENDVIPFGSVMGDRAELAGLNVVGLKRRGFSRETIHKIRAACMVLFGAAGTLAERTDKMALEFAAVPEAMEIISFIRAGGHRRLCTPRPGRWGRASDGE